MMTLFDESGRAKLVPTCTYPLTGLGCVSRVYTDVATFHITPQGVVVTETFGITVAQLKSQLDAFVTDTEENHGLMSSSQD